MKVPLLGQTGSAVSYDVSRERTINWYPVYTKTGKNEISLYPTYGIEDDTATITPSSGTGCNGVVDVGNGAKLPVFGDTLFLKGGVGTVSTIGTLNGDYRVISAVDGSLDANTTTTLTSNGKQALITDGNGIPHVLAAYNNSGAVGYRLWQLDNTTLMNTSGPVVEVTSAPVGSGYTIGDSITLSGGGSGTAVVTVDSIDASGGVVSATVTTAGSGYTEGNTYTTTGGTGTNYSAYISLVSSTATSTIDYELNDTTAAFSTNGVLEGMSVYNLTTDEYSKIVRVVSDTRLILEKDIFTSGNSYYIKTSYGVDFTTPISCTFIDGYFIVDDQNENTAGRFYISTLNNATVWNSLDYATAERNGDKLERVIAYKRTLWLMGGRTTEVWYNRGDSDFPFKPVQGGFIEYGTERPHTVQLVEDSLLFLAKSKFGAKTVLKADGLSVSSVINENIGNYVVNDAPDNNNTFSLTYSIGKNTFYCITYKGVSDSSRDSTIVYNLSTGLWHELGKAASAAGIWDVGGIWSSTTDNGYYEVGRYESNNWGQMNRTLYTDNESTIKRKRISGTLYNDGKHIYNNALAIELNAGEQYFVSGVSGNSVSIEGVDCTALGISNNNDILVSSVDGTSSTITNTLVGIIVTTSGVGTGSLVGHGVHIIDADTGKILGAYDVDLVWYDEGEAESGTKSRTVDTHKSIPTFRKLGKSRARAYEITIESSSPVIIEAITLDMDTEE